MKRLRNFFITSIIGGLLVILPVALLLWIFSIVVNFVIKYISPVTKLVSMFIIDVRILPVIIAVAIVVLICFCVGLIVKTKVGNWVHNNIEVKLLAKIPGYNMVKGALGQILSTERKTRPFSKVVLFKLYNNDILMTGIVSDDDHEEYVTIFCPTAPNPTSGFIYHVPRERVFPLDEGVENTMRTVLSGGSGSSVLIEEYLEKYVRNKENK
ncbi:Uncharacterized conserved protein [Sebaldella termitidis]|uniref:DUF502 domain-containing protein n=1 Tax=Sebaldella termitidis (strain ATCC 33386 / NCTC 11300) TaxID=526218 RepID=D1ARA9_SEBTE|nr:DUF502 domain-containing protein [Sebaldella termitidis]ACZ10395.1 protein of unknown function DUF502 [Sebaldella termitidis ATCC 33386]MBP7978912.1 DUF502 domain-containing protein [Sebaldella sp.]SUI25737.1 Uncharacterized conserved protein [Sebaldella termitidis]